MSCQYIDCPRLPQARPVRPCWCVLPLMRRSIFPDDGADTAADDAKSRSDAAAHEFPDGSADAARTDVDV